MLSVLAQSSPVAIYGAALAPSSSVTAALTDHQEQSHPPAKTAKVAAAALSPTRAALADVTSHAGQKRPHPKKPSLPPAAKAAEAPSSPLDNDKENHSPNGELSIKKSKTNAGTSIRVRKHLSQVDAAASPSAEKEKQKPNKAKSDPGQRRVAVKNLVTNRIQKGWAAPKEKNLEEFLQKNPDCEIYQSKRTLNRSIVRKQTSIAEVQKELAERLARIDREAAAAIQRPQNLAQEKEDPSLMPAALGLEPLRPIAGVPQLPPSAAQVGATVPPAFPAEANVIRSSNAQAKIAALCADLQNFHQDQMNKLQQLHRTYENKMKQMFPGIVHEALKGLSQSAKM